MLPIGTTIEAIEMKLKASQWDKYQQPEGIYVREVQCSSMVVW
jgi:hypothetical protein